MSFFYKGIIKGIFFLIFSYVNLFIFVQSINIINLFLSYYFQWYKISNYEYRIRYMIHFNVVRVNYSNKNFIFYHCNGFFNFPTNLQDVLFYYFSTCNLYISKNIYRVRYYEMKRGIHFYRLYPIFSF